MNLIWKKSECTNRPPEVDTESSKTTVFLYRNIEEKERTDEQGGESTIYYECDVAKLSRSDYGIYLAEKNAEMAEMQSEAIDYLLMGGE